MAVDKKKLLRKQLSFQESLLSFQESLLYLWKIRPVVSIFHFNLDFSAVFDDVFVFRRLHGNATVFKCMRFPKSPL